MSIEEKRLQKGLADLREKFAEERKVRGRRVLAALMRSDEGREALWLILDQTGLYAPELWSASAADLGRRAALRDFGQWLIDEMTIANEPGFFDLQRVFRGRAIEERLKLENEELRLRKEIFA